MMFLHFFRFVTELPLPEVMDGFGHPCPLSLLRPLLHITQNRHGPGVHNLHQHRLQPKVTVQQQQQQQQQQYQEQVPSHKNVLLQKWWSDQEAKITSS